MILFNPLLWFEPFNNFINYLFTDLNETGTIEVTNLILGQTYPSNDSPWFLYSLDFYYSFLYDLNINRIYSEMLFS